MTKKDKLSFEPQFDLEKNVVKIPVMVYKTGDGKIFFSNNCDPDIVKKMAIQVERRHQGVRSMEMGMMDRDKYNALKEDQILVLEVGSYN